MRDIKILLVEDARSLRHEISASLGTAGVRVDALASIPEARQRLARVEPRFLILDVDGQTDDIFSFLSELDSLGVETIVLADDTQTSQRIEYFERRVLDVIPKPLDMRELNLRLRRFLRPRPMMDVAPQMEIACGRATLDIANRALRQGRKKPVPLTASEFRLLYLLIQKETRVIDRIEIVREVLGHGQDSTSRSIDVMISKLRRKLDDVGAKRFIRSVRSEGYMLVGEERHEPRADSSHALPNKRKLVGTNGSDAG